MTDRSVNQDESWREIFDLADKKDGKYNIMVTAEDNGGNIALGGPFNIWIDPESDLPVVTITNPLMNMRVPGNLNIVGTCIDDDAVKQVELILDGDYEHPQLAEGKDFWSFYVDTNELSEGPHTIEAYGTDINGLRGHSTFVTWNLDRRQPITQVTNYTLGTLVSGKINLKGTIYDGNGIKLLSYSLNNGQSFKEVAITENKKTGNWEFTLPIDTRLSEDGPSVCWFRATDKMGSVGIYSFLYFIDNTKPDVRIVTPSAGEVCNGRFSVAGYAKDVIGIQKLTWSFAGETGELPLIPGNPYWYKEVDTIGMTAKSVPFTVSALDIAGNLVELKLDIPLNQELDKPVVSIAYPLAGEAYDGTAGSLFMRGIVNDDDGAIDSVEYQVDSGDVLTLSAQGVFYAPIADDMDLPSGLHTLTVTAVDKYGVRGNPAQVTFIVKDTVPAFAPAMLRTGAESVEATAGMIVHPESGAFVDVAVKADAGLDALSYRLSWGNDGVIENTVALNAKAPEKAKTLSIPVADFPWGIVRVTVTATDIYGRSASQTTVLNVQDLTHVRVDEPAVIFDDSTISPSGYVVSDASRPLTGFFIGGAIVSAEFVPPTDFATLDYSENLITVRPTSAAGVSSPVRVRVMTEQGVSYDSRELIFANNVQPARITLSEPTVAGSRYTFSGTVSGNGESRVSYRVLSSAAVMQDDYFTGKVLDVATGAFKSVDVEDGSFSFVLDTGSFAAGMYAVEAVSDNGTQTAAARFIRIMPALPETVNGKAVSAAKPVFSWLSGVDAYCVVHAQEALDSYGFVFPHEDMQSGSNEYTATVTTSAGKAFSSKKSFMKAGDARVSIASIDGVPFANGMAVVLPPPATQKEAESVLVARIVSDMPVKRFSYELSGEAVPGGDATQAGTAKLRMAGDNVYEADIPLKNLPVRITDITLTAETDAGASSYRGQFLVVREKDSAFIYNAKRIYWLPQENAVYNAETGRYTLAAETRIVAYANVPALLSVDMGAPREGIKMEVEGNSITILAEKEGVYDNIVLHVRDIQNVEFVSEPISLLVDSGVTTLSISAPLPHQWVQDAFELSVDAFDINGIAKVEYSTDGGTSWRLMEGSGSVYKAAVALFDREDGLISVDVRATDRAGRERTAYTAVQKDTTPPELTVVVPANEDIVNGENLLAFMARDNAGVSHVEYLPPPSAGAAAGADAALSADAALPSEEAGTAPVSLEVAPLVTLMVGTENAPIHDLMALRATDFAGNETTLRAWDFIIDAESDLPIAEVHLPEEDSVITRDFVISGVVLDDDGPSKIWWRIDDDEFVALPDYDNSFSIDIPLLSLTDNEHSVTVFAEDRYGVKGPEFVRNFKVSLEEPKGEVLTPPISETVKETITITGRATDKNGISAVYVSVDNGNSYNEALGTFGHDKIDTDWNYTFDTRVIQDGTHVVFVKIVDWYGIEGLYSSLINIDNTNPDIRLELPQDGSLTTGMVFFTGQTTDNVKLEKLYVTIRSLDGKEVSEELSHLDFMPDDIISQPMDLSSLEDGFYNIELVGEDAAENVTRVSRNVKLDKTAPKAKVDLLYPLNGEFVRGVFNIYGTAVSESPVKTLMLFVDGRHTQQTELTTSGYYKFRLTPEDIDDGQHEIEVHAVLENGQTILSNRQYVNYTAIGPWVTIDNFTYGDFAVDRPYIRGEAGYAIAEEDLIAAKSKDADPEFRAAVFAKAVDKVELSLNNGKTFTTIAANGKWRYRIENKDIAEGYHFLLVRATMKNGEVAVTRTIVQVDNTAPTVRLISPGAGGRYNQELLFSGLTHDDVALKDVTLYLRKGDKASYEVPGFIQGLYLDWHFWGASLFDIGMGLTFFDDNVKLQVQWGQFTKTQWSLFKQGDYRYGGDSIFGAKLLANVYYLPFRFLFGPDWEWLSMNVAVGANFTRFSDSGSGKAQILSAALAQLEFPRVTFDKQKLFRTLAFYTEGQLWFIPSDVSSDDIPTLVPQISFGLRVNVF